MDNIKMRKVDGTFAKNDAENAEVFEKHFRKLFNNINGTNYEPTVLDELTKIQTDNRLGESPTIAEINYAISKMANEKSPGPNGVTTEVYKKLKGNNLENFRNIINKFWNDPNYNPVEWAEIGLSVLPKKGDLSNPNKWRGIALEDIAAKCISSILALRLTKHLNTFGIDGQCGCLFGKGCTDATFAVKSAIQTLHEHDQQVYVLFVDLVKAFDSVNRELLWKILAVYGVPEKTIEVLKKLHTNITYQFKVGKILTKIEGNVGVKQGDNLGPILFIIMVNAVAKSLKKKWTFNKPKFRWHGMKANGSHKYDPKLKTGTNHNTKGETFEFVDSYYVYDAAYLLLNREDLE